MGRHSEPEDVMFPDSGAYPEMIVARAYDQLRELEHARRARTWSAAPSTHGLARVRAA
jgi:hypothetical protein